MTTGTVLVTTRRVATAITSLVTIAALVAGVPFLLWLLAGWPLPGAFPSADRIGRALTQTSVSDAAIIKAVALVGWLGWALLCWSLLTEAWAVIRGIPASRVRLAGPLQGVARQLVASASLLAATGMSSTVPATIAPATPQSLVVDVREPTIAAASPTPAVAPAASATTAAVMLAATPPSGTPTAVETDTVPPNTTYTVQRRDSLWKIAECHLGDPLRWRELWELNRGRDFGGVTFTNPNLIYAGWVLDLPTPVGDETAPAPSPFDETQQPPASTLPPASAEESDAPARHASPETFDAAPTTTEAATTTVTTIATTPETAATPPTSPVPETANTLPDEDLVSIPGSAPLFAGGVVLASAIVFLLTRLRRSQARRRPSGRAPHFPPASSASTETALRRTGDAGRVQRAFAALRAFAAGLGDADLPPLAAVRVSDTEVEVLVASPAALVPPGFDCDPDRRAFTVEADLATTTVEGLAGETAAPWPGVVTAGALGDDLVLIDVETAGLLTIDGPDAADTARRIAAELATSPASELIEVLVVGSEFELSGSERIRSVASIDEATEVLDAAGASTRAALDRLGDPNTAIARRDHSAEQGWGVTVLISLHPFTNAQGARLAQVARPGSGVAAVVVGEPVGGAWSLTSGPTIRLEPHGFDLAPATLTADELAAVDDLLADAMTGDSDERLLADGNPPETIYLPDSAEPTAAEAPSEVEVRVLGPVEVHGVKPINRRRTVELIAYLALHPGGVSAGRLKTAIWPEAEPSQDTFNVTVHRARSALGLDSGGSHHLPHAVTNGGNYSVGPHVTTDLTRFNALVRRARLTEDEAAEADLLRQAIRLLRGQVFEGVRGYEWVFTEAIVSEAEATISDAAHRLAQRELAQGDADAANWAATQGLVAVPGSEPLYRDRMEAAHLNGDPASVDRIVDELCRYIETLEPLDDLHPDTIKLWHRVGRRHTA